MMRENSKFTYNPPELKVPDQFQIFSQPKLVFTFVYVLCLQFPIRAVIHLFFPQSQKIKIIKINKLIDYKMSSSYQSFFH
jgi:hypothetical protein